MAHKEEMEWLKKNDPITYYELTSNPTGADEDSWGIGCLVWFLMIVGLISFALLWKFML